MPSFDMSTQFDMTHFTQVIEVKSSNLSKQGRKKSTSSANSRASTPPTVQSDYSDGDTPAVPAQPPATLSTHTFKGVTFCLDMSTSSHGIFDLEDNSDTEDLAGLGDDGGCGFSLEDAPCITGLPPPNAPGLVFTHSRREVIESSIPIAVGACADGGPLPTSAELAHSVPASKSSSALPLSNVPVANPLPACDRNPPSPYSSIVERGLRFPDEDMHFQRSPTPSSGTISVVSDADDEEDGEDEVAIGSDSPLESKIVPNTILERVGMRAVLPFKVAMCITCQTYVPPRTVYHHFTATHKNTKRSNPDINEAMVIQACTEAGLRDLRETQWWPDRPVYYHPIFIREEKGYACMADTSCHFVCLEESTMKAHFRTRHPGVPQAGNFRQCLAASLTKKTSVLAQQSFEVVDRPLDCTLQPAYERLLSTILTHAKELAPDLKAVVPAANARAIDLFHSRYGWNKALYNCDVTRVVGLASLPKRNEKLWPLRRSVEAYFDSVCKDAIPNLAHLLLRHLNTSKE